MLKSMLLVFAGAVVLAPFAMPGLAPRQNVPSAPAQAAAPAQNPAPALPQTPSGTPTPAASAAPANGAVTMAENMTNPVKPTPASQAKAKEIYSIDCAMCHGDNGNGKTDLATSMDMTMPDFTDPKSLDGKMDGELFNVIRNGKDKMPNEAEGRASDHEVWNLIIYIRDFSKPQAAAPEASAK